MLSSFKAAIGLAEDRRSTPRTRSRGMVRIGSRTYDLVNWSTTGLLIAGHRDHLIKGQRCRLHVKVTDGAEPLEFNVEAVVLRLQGDQLAAQFILVDKHKKSQFLNYFSKRHG